jgi:hypothetical protein
MFEGRRVQPNHVRQWEGIPKGARLLGLRRCSHLRDLGLVETSRFYREDYLGAEMSMA